jgi:hypothetical protein
MKSSKLGDIRKSVWEGKGKGKRKVVLVLVTEYHAMKAYWGIGGIDPRVLYLGTRCR